MEPPRLFVVLLIPVVVVVGQFNWQVRDKFDEVTNRMRKVTEDNCKIVDINDMFLPNKTVTHVPNTKQLGIDPVFPNRTNLLHIHNMAISRAFFYSYILQKAADNDEPGFMYYFLSTIADVASNRFINSSAIYFSPNVSYTPSYKGFFNKTLPLFAPRAFRSDDFNDPFHLERISTLNTIEAVDLGAIPSDSISANYTREEYKINEWYSAWLPDSTKRHDTKTTYHVQITHNNGTNETFVWHGPPDASEQIGPVKWNRPYFDCGRSNKWIYGASVPFPDIYPRHTGWRHIEIPIYVGVAVMELDFERIDINQCPLGNGNPPPNYFESTAKCKKDTTECEPIHGYGFRRGGYQCRCRPGYRLPRVVRNPYSGEIIERATGEEYRKGFHCDKINYLMAITQKIERLSQEDRRYYIEREMPYSNVGNISAQRLDPTTFLEYIYKNITKDNCSKILEESPEKLILRGDVAFGKEEQLENEARMALRLANFISAFLQIVDPKEMFAEYRVPDKPLTVDQIIGEILSIVTGDKKIQGAGVYFDRNQFPNRTLFGPYVYRKQRNARQFFVDDNIYKNKENSYLNKDWFNKLKIRWSANTDELETYTTKIDIRYNSTGLHTIHYDHYPLQYKAAAINHGYWTSPYFDCGGFHETWLIKYAAPFFGWDKIKNRLEFKGVVAVSMRLDELDLNQCQDEYYVQNAFKNTHKCDRRSSRCVPILGRGFEAGGYKCECLQGYEYPFVDPITYFDGQILEAEFEKAFKDQPSRFDTQKCRIAGSVTVQANLISILLLLILNRVFF
ncbi:uncharacterized protein LOC111638939 [Centruroides sculpturatus]|uniref:uncharacterized protein LOC111638939 n=1 Tax=Centruroides sculpturatus TaxID=218467 RepID=UPI000C6EA4D6|nr:uncharacterized protein LOC111638939 [Centruroides sculpturatus]